MRFSLNLIRELLLLIVFSLCAFSSYSAEKEFVVVIDAGHGGKDAGAIGYTLKLREKVINLKAALKLGAMLEKESGVKVIYTRKKDVFIPLNERAQIANKAKADLFISIHTNSATNRSARGTETFTVGSSSSNLEVAMRENSVILYENDYKAKYEGFDPNSTESYIMFDYIQSSYMDKSISFASKVESQFAAANRRSRGVKQAGFLVLKQTTMPGVLVELGYISNKEEELFLNKDANIEVLCKAIYKAFLSYKKQYDKNNGTTYQKETQKNESSVSDKKTDTSSVTNSQTTNTKDGSSAKANDSSANKTTPAPVKKEESKQEDKKDNGAVAQDEIRYAVQFCSSNVQKPLDCKDFKGCVPALEFIETGTYKYKYVYGSEKTFQEGLRLRDEVKKKFPDAFLVVLKNGKKLPMDEARKYYK